MVGDSHAACPLLLFFFFPVSETASQSRELKGVLCVTTWWIFTFSFLILNNNFSFGPVKTLLVYAALALKCLSRPSKTTTSEPRHFAKQYFKYPYRTLYIEGLFLGLAVGTLYRLPTADQYVFQLRRRSLNKRRQLMISTCYKWLQKIVENNILPWLHLRQY